MRSLFSNDKLTLNLCQRMTNTDSRSSSYYGEKAWILKAGASAPHRLEAFEIWLHRRNLTITWVAHISNEWVLKRAK